MIRLLRRALQVFGVYATVLAATIVAGFLAQRFGTWAAVLWGVGILTGLAIYVRRRLGQSRAE